MPTRRLAVVAAVVALGVVAAPRPALALAVANLALLMVALADWMCALRPQRLTITRFLPRAVVLGAEIEVGWTVTNPSGRRLRVELADDLAPSLATRTRRARLSVPKRRSAQAATNANPTRRGRFDSRGITVRVHGPLGLAARQAFVALPGTIRVYPPFRSRAEAELRVRRAQLLAIGLRSVRGAGGGTDFDSLREYSPDDDFRRIDWSATARSSHTIVRTYRAERNQTVVVLLDTGRTMAGQVIAPAGPGRPEVAAPRLDHALDAVMALTAVGTRLGDRVGLVAFDDYVRAVVAAAPGSAQLARVTEALYRLEPRLVESDYRGAFLTALGRFRRRCLLVIVSDLVAEAVAETLLPALPLVLRRHLVMVVGVTDPEVLAWARAVPTDATGAYRKAAAVSGLDSRSRTVARLRALGADVVDAEPQHLAMALADAYIDIKMRGRL